MELQSGAAESLPGRKAQYNMGAVSPKVGTFHTYKLRLYHHQESSAIESITSAQQRIPSGLPFLRLYPASS